MPAAFPSNDEQPTLERLKEQMEQAKALYEGAKLEYDRASERMKELGRTHPDGTMRHAATVYNHCLAIYRQATVEFNRFLLDRSFPGRKTN